VGAKNNGDGPAFVASSAKAVDLCFFFFLISTSFAAGRKEKKGWRRKKEGPVTGGLLSPLLNRSISKNLCQLAESPPSVEKEKEGKREKKGEGL